MVGPELGILPQPPNGLDCKHKSLHLAILVVWFGGLFACFLIWKSVTSVGNHASYWLADLSDVSDGV